MITEQNKTELLKEGFWSMANIVLDLLGYVLDDENAPYFDRYDTAINIFESGICEL